MRMYIAVEDYETDIQWSEMSQFCYESHARAIISLGWAFFRERCPELGG